MSNSLFRRKSLDKIVKDAKEGIGDGHGGTGLKKVLNVKDLTFMGIAAVVGAGIFSTIGLAAYDGGPGISLLFILTAVTCGFSALCYAEFASRVPIAGSAYTYAYVSFGELIAWIITDPGTAKDSFLAAQETLAKNPGLTGDARASAQHAIDAWNSAPIIAGHHIFVNLPAFFIVCIISFI